VCLVPISGRLKKSEDASERRDRLAETLAEHAYQAIDNDAADSSEKGLPDKATGFASEAIGVGAKRVAVVANTVASARKTFDELRSRADRADTDLDLHLLVGRCRGFEVEKLGLADRVRARFAAQDDLPPCSRPAILVATQTIEVGADFDVDVLITEAAPIDALMQRLGRLNRLARRRNAKAFYVYDEAIHSKDHPIYGDRISRTWEWLNERTRANTDSTNKDTQCLELGLNAVASLTASDDDLKRLRECATEEGVAPVLLKPHVATLVRTSPKPQPDQPVEPFLHGLDRGSPEVSICWRAPLPTPEAWKAELDVVPIHQEELVAVPLWVARRFLLGMVNGPLSDLEAAGDPGPEDKASSKRIVEVVQHEDGSVDPLEDISALRPGDTVIVKPDAGGHDEWGWTGSAGFVLDVADLVGRRRRVLRLRPEVIALFTGKPGNQDVEYFRRLMSLQYGSNRELAEALLNEALAKAKEREDPDPITGRWIDHAEAMLGEIGGGRVRITAPGGPKMLADLGLIVQAGAGGLYEQAGDVRTATPRPKATNSGSGGLDEQAGDVGTAASSFADGRVSLSRHLGDVGAGARACAQCLGLGPGLVRAAELAGLLHDVGKAERRFQVMLYRGDRDRLEAAGLVLAKSGMDPSDRVAMRKASSDAGVPSRWRHEAASSEIVRQVAAKLKQAGAGENDVDWLLVEHLVATHHGNGRPLFYPVEATSLLEVLAVDNLIETDGEAAVVGQLAEEVLGVGELKVDHVDWTGPRRLAALCKRYGWWGVAFLESIVRLVDIAVSEGYGKGGNELSQS
jgi:CRISPR-associated endonuclease/helicase Cas3